MATWTISQMEDYVDGPEGGPHEGESRVVYTLHWQCRDELTVETEGEEDVTHSARVYSSVSLEPFAEGATFTPWEDVTEAQALGWLSDALGAEEVTRVEESVAAQLEANINPTTLSGVPWSE